MMMPAAPPDSSSIYLAVGLIVEWIPGRPYAYLGCNLGPCEGHHIDGTFHPWRLSLRERPADSMAAAPVRRRPPRFENGTISFEPDRSLVGQAALDFLTAWAHRWMIVPGRRWLDGNDVLVRDMRGHAAAVSAARSDPGPVSVHVVAAHPVVRTTVRHGCDLRGPGDDGRPGITGIHDRSGTVRIEWAPARSERRRRCDVFVWRTDPLPNYRLPGPGPERECRCTWNDVTVPHPGPPVFHRRPRLLAHTIASGSRFRAVLGSRRHFHRSSSSSSSSGNGSCSSCSSNQQPTASAGVSAK